MKKLVMVFVGGVVVGFVLGVAYVKEDMPLFSSPETLDEAREAFDGSTDAMRRGMKNMLP
ncbi:MAG: hypothetical protein AB1810_10420 [Pseudomonadota bacterium]